MVIETEYQEGLDAFLSRKINADELLEFGKEILYYAAYALPGVGIYRQYRKPKEERNKAGVIFSDILVAGFVIKLALLYGGKVAATGDWNPFHFNSKEKTEQVQDIPKMNKNSKRRNGLEKTVHYDNILK